MQHRRKSPRLRSFKAGRIRFHRDWPIVDCAVRNLSVAGACLDLPGEFNLSLGFELTLPIEKKTRTCRQIWRQGTRVGVAFG
jgi:hypothetical protein